MSPSILLVPAVLAGIAFVSSVRWHPGRARSGVQRVWTATNPGLSP